MLSKPCIGANSIGMARVQCRILAFIYFWDKFAEAVGRFIGGTKLVVTIGRVVFVLAFAKISLNDNRFNSVVPDAPNCRISAFENTLHEAETS